MLTQFRFYRSYHSFRPAMKTTETDTAIKFAREDAGRWKGSRLQAKGGAWEGGVLPIDRGGALLVMGVG